MKNNGQVPMLVTSSWDTGIFSAFNSQEVFSATVDKKHSGALNTF